MKFMNMDKWLYQNPQDTAGQEDKAGGGGQQSTDDSKVTISSSELQTLIAQGIAAALGDNKPEEKESLSEKRAREQEESQKQRERDIQNQQFALRNIQFDSFISGNEKNIPESMKTIRADVEKMVEDKNDLSKVVPLLWGTAAKEYFSNPENLKNLTKSDQDWVTQNVLSVRYEHAIDGIEAAKYMDRAIEAGHRKADDSARRNGTATSTALDGFPNIKNYIEKFFAPINNRYKQDK